MGQQIATALRQSTHRVLEVLVSFLPGVLASLLALLVFTLIGFSLAAIVRRILVALHFDERLAAREPASSATHILDWSPSHAPSLLISRAILWISVFLGLAVGVSAFDASYAADSHVSILLIPYFTHTVGAILILLAGNLIARFLARSVLIGAVNAQLHYARFLSLGIKWLVLVLTAAMALDHLHVGGIVVELAFGILFGGIVLTLALAIGLGSRDLVTRSIERTMDLATPRPGPAEVPSPAETASRLRHF